MTSRSGPSPERPTVRAVLRRASARSRTSVGDRAYLVYMVFLVLLIAVGPVLRAAWVLLGEPGALASVAGVPLAQAAAAALGLIGAALLVGAVWGPAVRSPWLTRLLADSPWSRARAFGLPVLVRVVLTTLALATVGAVVVGPVTVAGGVSWTTAALAVCAAALTGLCTGLAILLGQALGRRGRLAGAGLVATAAADAALGTLPAVREVRWLTVGAGVAFVVALGVVAAALAAVSARALRSLTTPELITNALRSSATLDSAASFDVGTITGLARSLPSAGRRVRAVRPALPLWATFLRRDAVGALRTPDRLVLAVAGLAAAGWLAALAPTPGPWVGAAAGATWFLALAPLTDGIRHAATVTVGPPLYGVTTARLALLHTLLPIAASLLVVGVVGAANASGAAVLTAATIALAAVALRAGDAAKPPLPIELLTPVPTPMGDMAALFRLLWASDALLFAALAGAASAVLLAAPWWVLGAFALVALTLFPRWRTRP